MKYARVYANAEPELTEGDVFRAFIPIRDQTRAQASASLTTSDKGSAKNVGDAIELLLNSLGYTTPAEVARVAEVSTKTAKHHLAAMVERDALVAEGTTRDRKYRRA